MKLYDKRDDFNFPIVNFPFVCNNIPAAPVYEVYITQDFLDRGLLITRKLLNQGFLLVKFMSLLRKLCGRHHDMVYRDGISVTNDHGYVQLVVYTSLPFSHS